MRIPTATKSAQGRAKQLTAERLVNLYAEAAPGGSKSPVAVHGCPGLTRFCDDFSEFLAYTYNTGWVKQAGTDIQTDTSTSLGRGMATDGTNMLYVGDGGRTYFEGNGFNRVIISGWTGTVDSVTWGGGVWVVVGASGQIATSTDGTTWTTRTSGTSLGLTCVEYGNGTFIACGPEQGVRYSTDGGATWTFSSFTTIQRIRVVGWVQHLGLWIAAGEGNNGTAYSSDGISWTHSSWSSPRFNVDGERRIASNGDTVLLVRQSTTATGPYYSSTDGKTWTAQTNPSTSNITSVISDGTSFLMTAYTDSDGNSGGLFQSFDGVTWDDISKTLGGSFFTTINTLSSFASGKLWVCDSGGDVYYTQGTATTTSTNDDRPRGLYRMARDGSVFVVAGLSLYRVDEDGTSTNLGTIAGSGRVGMADNGDQLCIVTGSKGYIWDATNGLQTITAKGFPGAETVAYLDGFFIFNNPGSGQKREQFFISKLRDGLVYDASDFASAEAYPDNLKRVVTDHSELILFGEQTTEIWFNAGAADFPFRRAQGSIIEKGLGATWSVAQLDESVMWLDQHGIVRRLQGGTPVRMSTHDIEYRIKQGDWENATAWSYYDEGHNFYVLTVPRRNTSQTAGTYVYDAATGLWHERKSKDRPYSRSGFYVAAYGKHLTCDIDKTIVYEQSLEENQEDGDSLVAEMIFPQVQNDGERFIVDQFRVDMEVGDVPDSSDPQVMLQESSDGRTWGMLEPWHTMGKQGEYSTRVKWDQRGQHETYTAKISISAPVKRAIFAAYAKIRPTR